MKNLILLLIVLAPFFALAQKKSDFDKDKVYSYNILRNDPEFTKTLTSHLNPLYADVNSLNLFLALNAGLEYRFKNRAIVDLNYTWAYLQLTENEIDEYSPHGFSIYENPKENFFHGQIKIYPFKDLKEVDETVRLKSVGDIMYVANVPSNRLFMLGFRAGIQKGVGLVSGDEVSFTGTSLDSNNVEVFRGSDFTNAYEYTTLNIGVSYLKITDLITVWKDFGEREHESSYEIYADFLFATKMKLDNMYAGLYADQHNDHGDFYAEYDVSETPNNPIGARIGFRYTSLSSVGVMYGGEVGLRPGPVANKNLYAMVTLGISFAAIDPQF